MAIISGFKPADVKDVSPLVLPIDDMAKGLILREDRAQKAKNAFTTGDASLAIPTRANQEDYDLAAKIRNEYHSDIERLATEAGGDWSKIDMSQISAAAMNKAQDTRTKNLIDHKTQADIASKQKQELMTKFGSYEQFGKDIMTSPLWETGANGEQIAANPSAWEIDQHLDYEQAAQKMYMDIGHDLEENAEAYGYNKGTSMYEMIKSWESNKTNHPQIDAVINSAYDAYIAKPEGKQYKKVLERDYGALGFAGKELEDLVHDKIQKLITWTGHSKYITEHKETKGVDVQNIPQPSTGGSGGGNGGSGKTPPLPVFPAPKDQVLTYYGATYENYDMPLDGANAITDPNVPMLQQPTDPTELKNIPQLTSYLLETGNVDVTTNSGNDKRYNGG